MSECQEPSIEEVLVDPINRSDGGYWVKCPLFDPMGMLGELGVVATT
jgi:hypothetical protein